MKFIIVDKKCWRGAIFQTGNRIIIYHRGADGSFLWKKPWRLSVWMLLPRAAMRDHELRFKICHRREKRLWGLKRRKKWKEDKNMSLETLLWMVVFWMWPLPFPCRIRETAKKDSKSPGPVNTDSPTDTLSVSPTSPWHTLKRRWSLWADYPRAVILFLQNTKKAESGWRRQREMQRLR